MIVNDYVKQCDKKNEEIELLKAENTAKNGSLADLEKKSNLQRDKILTLTNSLENFKTSEQLRQFVENKVQSMEDDQQRSHSYDLDTQKRDFLQQIKEIKIFHEKVIEDQKLKFETDLKAVQNLNKNSESLESTISKLETEKEELAKQLKQDLGQV